jgi:hypothetical protein
MRNGLVRSLLQVVLLSAAVMVLSTTRAQAHYENWCLEEAAYCSQMCGNTITYQLQYSQCFAWGEPPNQWDCLDWRHHWEWEWTTGIDNFECDEVAGSSWCQCAY